MAPLIGMKVDTDLLDWLIMSIGGGFGKYLKVVKGLAARTKSIVAGIEHGGVLSPEGKKEAIKEAEAEGKEKEKVFAHELYVKFTADGEITAKCKWEKKVDDSWLSLEGDKTASASAKITFKLAAVAKAKAEAFCVKISIGAELHLAGAKSSAEGIGIETTLFATTAENKPALGGNIRFTGMAIYFTSWAEAGLKTVESDNAAKKKFKRKNGKPVKKTEVNLNEKKKYDHKQVIFKESTWPDTKKIQPLSEAKL